MALAIEFIEEIPRKRGNSASVYRAVPCAFCKALIGKRCQDMWKEPIGQYHSLRRKLYELSLRNGTLPRRV